MNLVHESGLGERVIGAAIAVHRQLGPGLLESAYEECLCFELKELGIQFERQLALPVRYKGVRLDCGYRLDIVVERELLVELKSAERLFADPRGADAYLLAPEWDTCGPADEFQQHRPQGWIEAAGAMMSVFVFFVSLW